MSLYSPSASSCLLRLSNSAISSSSSLSLSLRSPPQTCSSLTSTSRFHTSRPLDAKRWKTKTELPFQAELRNPSKEFIISNLHFLRNDRVRLFSQRHLRRRQHVHQLWLRLRQEAVQGGGEEVSRVPVVRMRNVGAAAILWYHVQTRVSHIWNYFRVNEMWFFEQMSIKGFCCTLGPCTTFSYRSYLINVKLTSVCYLPVSSSASSKPDPWSTSRPRTETFGSATASRPRTGRSATAATGRKKFRRRESLQSSRCGSRGKSRPNSLS